jgi:hypothetical protein
LICPRHGTEDLALRPVGFASMTASPARNDSTTMNQKRAGMRFLVGAITFQAYSHVMHMPSDELGPTQALDPEPTFFAGAAVATAAMIIERLLLAPQPQHVGTDVPVVFELRSMKIGPLLHHRGGATGQTASDDFA